MTAAVIVEGGRQGRVPLALIAEAAAEKQPGAALLWAWLEGRYANVTGESWPGRQRLADDLGVSKDTVDRWLRWLRDRGWLEVVARYTEAGDQTSNLYRLKVGADRVDTPEVAAPVRPPGGRVDAALTTQQQLNPRGDRKSAVAEPGRTNIGAPRSDDLEEHLESFAALDPDVHRNAVARSRSALTGGVR